MRTVNADALQAYRGLDIGTAKVMVVAAEVLRLSERVAGRLRDAVGCA